MRWLGRGLVLAALSGACTFGSLASYDIEQCSVAATQTADACNRLNDGNPTTCNPWQCNGATGACEQKVRDDDRDGDPPVSCGGGDCDDTDPALSSLKVSTPTNLASVSVGGSTPTFSYDGVTPMMSFTAFQATGPCLALFQADPPASTSLMGCSANVDGSSPTQAYALAVTQGDQSPLGAAFIARTGCASGTIGFAYLPRSSAEVDVVGSCGSGAALPALALFPGGKAAVAFYETAAAPLDTPLETCPAARPSSLAVLAIADITNPSFGSPIALSPGAISMGPPAMVWQSRAFLVASPDASAATIWALDEASLEKKATLVLPALAGARAVAIGAVTDSDGTVHIAVVAEIGCSPQSIHVALVGYDPSGSSFTALGDAELSPAGSGFQNAPSIAWSAARSHWLATWAAAGPSVFARFVDDSAKPTRPPFEVAAGAFAATALTNSHVVLASTMSSGTDALLDSKGQCP